ncbi:MAG: hypothetical protein COV29_03570 [Candidatus Yanofskybacteria bacterium CG10_big_fil_rev_8_21_14_0_10_36_16]|uniref:Sortase n=1 Tax=Candidatus Yanofskybacteria bacterium CG10_big_fil_rev_8_21_14_0_10_36_16 TaxID=1975096 RepID=A0A2J0Q798_9BACT|nr:MAG: hypothetical protein COV29_03570 [Candidatus Yanofskybacteria bacterium CG10_big_fil_rev_8_21_14_0_10_36_16]
MANKLYKHLGFIFILIALIGIGWPFLRLGFLSDATFLGTIAETENIQPPIPASVSFEYTPSPNDFPEDVELKNIKNRLVIPQANINMPLFYSDNSQTLFKGGWLWPHNNTPAQGGNTVIFGHRFRFLPPVKNTFYNLDKVNIGDEFSLTWQGKIYTYRVVEIKIIEPTDLSVIASSDNSIITLITCSPLFSTKQRLVVVAELI